MTVVEAGTTVTGTTGFVIVHPPAFEYVRDDNGMMIVSKTYGMR